MSVSKEKKSVDGFRKDILVEVGKDYTGTGVSVADISENLRTSTYRVSAELLKLADEGYVTGGKLFKLTPLGFDAISK